MVIKAALLDENGIYQGMDALASEEALTERHVRTITECDLPPGRYRWVAHGQNMYGGEFVPLSRAELKRKGLA